MREQISLGPMPVGRVMQTVDELVVRASPRATFDIVRQVEAWPTHLAHYRHVRMRERAAGGSGIVEMSANRPFGPLNWPTWWLSEMALDADRPAIRFHHIGGITRGMDVEWGFLPHASGTLVRLLHYWNGPSWPVIGRFAAQRVIGPVFIHGIASRTLAGLARVAEQGSIPSDMAVSA
jgi:ribosome-associated toxin RatA of RatAB toxin-antitoxin module